MFLLVVLLVNSAVCQVTLTALNTSIRAKTTYTFTFQSASLGQTIKITIPSEISTAGTTWVPSATSSSGNTYEWQSVTTFVFNLTNVTNLRYVWQPQFVCSWGSNSSVVALRNLQPGSISKCQITFQNDRLRKSSIANLVFQTGNSLLNGSIYLKMPTSWSNTINNDKIVNTTTLTCKNSTQTVSCDYYQFPYPPVLSIATKQYSGTVNFTIDSFVTPPTTLIEQTISIMSVYLNGLKEYTIDTWSTCTVIPPNATKATISAYNVSTFNVSTNIVPQFSYNLTDLLADGDVVNITLLHSDTLLQEVNMTNVTISLSAGGTSLKLIYGGSATTATGLRSHRYTLINNSQKILVSESGTLFISGPAITSFPYAITLNAMNISLYRAGSLFSSGNASLTTTSNYLVASLEPADLTQTILTQTNLTITLKSNEILKVTTGSIVIKVPPEFTFSNTTCSATLSSGILAKCQMSSLQATIKNFTADVANTTFTISIFNITTPGSEAPTSNFTISSYYNDTHETATNTFLRFRAKAASISNCSLSIANSTTSQQTTYTLTFNNAYELPNNSILSILLPRDVQTTHLTTTQVNSQSMSFSLSNNTVNITLNKIFLKNTPIVISLLNVTNPNSTKGFSSFGLTAYNSGYAVEQNNSIPVNITFLVRNLNNVNLTQSSRTNNANSTHTFSIDSTVNYSSAYVLDLTVPNNIHIGSIGCAVNSITAACSVANRKITVSMPATGSQFNISISNLQNYRSLAPLSDFFTILIKTVDGSNMENGTKTVLTNTNSNYLTQLALTMVEPAQSYRNSAQIFTISMEFTTNLQTGDTLTLTLPNDYLRNGDNSSICLKTTNITCSLDSTNLNIVKVQGFTNSSSKSLQIKLTGFSAIQNVTKKNVFNVSTFDSSGYIIDTVDPTSQATKLTFLETCHLPCRTCTSNLSECLTCYSFLIDGADYSTYNNISKKCGSDCGLQYFKQSDGLCASCPTNCKVCLNSTICQTCMDNYVLRSDVCVAGCPERYYNSSGKCLQCDVSCYNCSVISTNCTSCLGPQGIVFDNISLLYSCKNCVDMGKYYNEETKLCVVCQPPCLKCDQNTCYECQKTYLGQIYNKEKQKCVTVCSQGTSLYLQECIDQCPEGMVDEGGVCLNEKWNIPMPFTIVAAILVIVGLISKIKYRDTQLCSYLSTSLSVLSTINILVLTIIASSKWDKLQHGIWCLITALSIQLFMNVIGILLYKRFVEGDNGYNLWKNHYLPDKSVGGVLYRILSVINHRVLPIVFSRLFGADGMSAYLLAQANYIVITVIWGISLVVEALAVAGCIIIIVREVKVSQLCMLALDCLVLLIGVMLSVVLDLKKPQGYFSNEQAEVIQKVQGSEAGLNMHQTVENLNPTDTEVALPSIQLKLNYEDKRDSFSRGGKSKPPMPFTYYQKNPQEQIGDPAELADQSGKEQSIVNQLHLSLFSNNGKSSEHQQKLEDIPERPGINISDATLSHDDDVKKSEEPLNPPNYSQIEHVEEDMTRVASPPKSQSTNRHRTNVLSSQLPIGSPQKPPSPPKFNKEVHNILPVSFENEPPSMSSVTDNLVENYEGQPQNISNNIQFDKVFEMSKTQQRFYPGRPTKPKRKPKLEDFEEDVPKKPSYAIENMLSRTRYNGSEQARNGTPERHSVDTHSIADSNLHPFSRQISIEMLKPSIPENPMMNQALSNNGDRQAIRVDDIEEQQKIEDVRRPSLPSGRAQNNLNMPSEKVERIRKIYVPRNKSVGRGNSETRRSHQKKL